ncbi:FMN-dependent dehydrogenase, includes L-lactate dehydrogenase and type II isopentenyl diphosphate isomerase [Pelagirhabdus alkalitolerans]|uniref:L-lactate oxidase n=1 Tax=Pelagirhabdus alkalitolerans TaxID=1612202 RepID=A0A1G6GMU7_9BACI|nr:alpha-hydroxy-acid oxidizing protein [Pelagirhabdus alkalitolerans]SDB83055.1 FMN-dependent dehydrogenase, includes L-lactate dehydrogenase and type II isopentenyl diphosphate isomerase [Pelagirhabdus alkalitolerans]
MSETNARIRYEDWEHYAKKRLSKGAFGYVQSGSNQEQTLVKNREAFNDLELVPRVLKDVSNRDLSIKLLNQSLAVPFLLAPVGFQRIVHPDAERASAKSAQKAKVPYIMSTVSSTSIEEVSEIMRDVPHYFQLYWPNDQDVCESFVKRAEKSGFDAIVVTVDTPYLGHREVDLSNGYSPINTGAGIENFLTDPVFQEKYNPNHDLSEAELIDEIKSILFKQDLTWSNIRWLKKITDLPIILKGVMHVDDAKLAVEEGIDGLIVSNHGGRQLDGTQSALKALQTIRQEIGDDIPILVDGGVRGAPDVLKALAIGADAVLIGRPYTYALVDGEAGVDQVLNNFTKDLDTSLAILGVNQVKKIDTSVITNSVNR